MNYSVIKVRKFLGKFRIETPKNFRIDELICLRSKMYAFKSGDDSKKNKNEFLRVNRKILNLKNKKNV